LKIENCNLLIPPKNLCTDNALMVAVAGYFRWEQGKIENWRDIEAKANLRLE
jgi:tRNA A37 threonylcarbamoyltransferase TsaD